MAINIPKGVDKSTRMALQRLSAKLSRDLAANKLIYSDGRGLLSVEDLTDWIKETANQVIVTDNSDGTITLSLPQDYHTGASPTLAGLTITGFNGVLMATSGAISALSDGDADQYLKTDGAGTYSWGTPSEDFIESGGDSDVSKDSIVVSGGDSEVR